MSDDFRPERPELTMPEKEASVLRAAYKKAKVILEYGSGGSTIMAAEMPGKTVFSIESDQDWAEMMTLYLKQNPPADKTKAKVIWCDIGPTKEWGRPVDHSSWRRFIRYPLQIWNDSAFKQPDVVLVDGRFRIGCALATLYRTVKPVTLYFDDYLNRTHYHRVEEFLGTPTITGRLARFDIAPAVLPPADMMRVINLMQRP